ncbi:AraC family transcriptional regulator [Undibacterium sp. SXout20W]|uniref:AraC family transcriptional regulator n=1 Tax=Undibacterium sp. SXout20W TaxID=3413051 RepID=UPI003BF25F37
MDTLTNFLDRYHLRTSMFYAGNFCGRSHYKSTAGVGHIHFVESGNIELKMPGKKTITIKEPSVIFLTSSEEHNLNTKPHDSVHLVCGTIDLGLQEGSQLFKGMPDCLVLSLVEFPELKDIMSLLFAEAGKNKLGAGKAINSLLEYFVILLLRHVTDHELVGQGVLAALGNKELGQLMVKLHQSPNENWTVQSMGQEIGMSRTKFSNYFKHCLGETPLQYLTHWRLNLARQLIDQGCSLKLIPGKVGYASELALSRAYQKKFNITPATYRYSLRR